MTASAELVTTEAARALSALAGAGRRVLLITNAPPEEAVTAWIPGDSLCIAGQAINQSPEPAPRTTADDGQRAALLARILSGLAGDTHRDTRRMVAANPDTPTQTLTSLAADPDRYVRWKVAGNPNTPVEVLRTLLRNNMSALAVAGNPNCPVELAQTLVRQVAEDSIRRIRIDEDEEDDEAWETLRDILALPNCPVDILRSVSTDDRFVRHFGRDAWRNPNAPVDVLLETVRRMEPEYRDDVMNSPHAPPEVLRIIAADDQEGVRCVAAANPNTPHDVMW